jgi:hypothetical protein
MNSRRQANSVLPKGLVLLILLAASAVLSAAGEPPKKPSAPPKAAPSKPASAPHAPAQHPGGGAQHPAGGGQHPAANNAQHPGGGNVNRSVNHAPAGSPNRPGQTPGNRPAQAGNKPGEPGGNRPGQAGGNRPQNAGAAAGPHQPAGSKNVSLKGGGSATVRKDGSVRSIDRNGMHIEHGVHGSRTVVGTHNGARVVNTGKRGGYVQRPYVNRNGHSYYSRTYVGRDGRAYTGVYRGYNYGGHVYYGYYPGYYYNPGFYAWGYNPWASPVVWGVGLWGWGGAPWFGFYGGWFNPYPFYAGPAFWLTDYLIAANLQAAYAAQADYAGGGINVVANQPWMDTGTQVVQGQTYNINASGVAFFSGDDGSAVGPNGQPHPCGPSCAAPGLPAYSLVGRIGPSGVPFAVGPHRTIVASDSGELFLSMNDETWGFGDNRGSWVATISQPGGDNSSGDQQADNNGNNNSGGSGPALTPEVKQAIADEVKAQLSAEQAQAGQTGGSNSAAPAAAPANGNGNEVPPALDPARRTFVVDNQLTVISNGQECGLTAGDVLTRLTDTPDADNTVNAAVTATKKSDCAAGSTVAVKVDDLQEMQNHFDEQLNNGMSELAKKQGTNGMPASPNTSTTPSDVPPPAPDATAAKTLQDQQQAADQTDAQVKQEVAGSSGGGQ